MHAESFSEGTGSSPAGTISHLAQDYPEPLTEGQRRSFQRYVNRQIFRYHRVHKTTTLISRGFSSLCNITHRLEEEKKYLEGFLSEKETGELGQESATNHQPSTTVPPPPAPAPSKRRGFGRLAMIQTALRDAQKEEKKREETTMARERITKEVRLHQVEKDLEEHRSHYEVLKKKHVRCAEVEKEVKSVLLSLLSIGEAMMIYEPLYCSSFFFHASGELPAGLDGTSNEAQLTLPNVPFKPAVYTPENETVLRSQIEDVLDDYVSYRSRIDPVLAKLDEEQKKKQVEHMDESRSAPSDDAGLAIFEDLQPPEEKPALLDGVAESNDEADRNLVQCALTALDDFGDL